MKTKVSNLSLKRILLTSTLGVASLSSNFATAAFYDRGGGMIYDSTLNVTWLQDANYAYTSGYAAAHANGDVNSSPANTQANGAMGRDAAMAWADQLVYGGYNDWRLPFGGGLPSTWHVEIGLLIRELDSCGFPQTCNYGANVSFSDAAGGGTKSFINVQHGGTDSYWYSDVNSATGNAFVERIKEDAVYGSSLSQSNFAWAVRDGDVAAVPVPSTSLLFASGLAGLIRISRKYKSKRLLTY